MKPILIILLVAISALTARRVNASESADAETATAEFISEILPIKYAKAEDIADVLTYLIGSGGGNKDNIQHLLRHASISNGWPALGHIKLLTDVRGNSLLITSTRPDMETIKNIVLKLDVVLPQILIEGAVLTVRLPDNSGAGRQHSARQPPAPVDRFLASAMRWFTNLVPISTANDVVGRQDGFGYMAGLGNGFNSTVAALGSDHRVNIIQKPRIQTSSGVSATIWLSEVHFPRNYSCSTYPGPPIPQSWIEQWGEIEVTPSIRPDGLIAIEIQATANKVIEKTRIAGVRDVPNTSSARSRASAVVCEGEILMIGRAFGVPKQRTSGIPVLKRIPVLGSFFHGSSADQFGNEVVVLLRPTILPGPASERASH